MTNVRDLLTKLNEASLLGTNEQLENIIFDFISEDKRVIPALIKILSYEREANKKLLIDMNSALSMEIAALESQDKSIIETAKLNIKMFYKKYEDKLRCNFKIHGLK